MTPTESFDRRPPSAEELAAYSDGELEPARSEAIEAWLAAHPDRRAEVDALRRLMRLYQETQPAEPPARAWDAVLEQVKAGMTTVQSPAAPSRRRAARPVQLTLALASAAALVGLWLLARSWWTPPAVLDDSDDEPYPVASADDITVISLEPADRNALVVGQPPIGDNYEFASREDVTVVKIEGTPEDRRPPEMLPGEVPMLFAPDVVSPRRD